MNMFIIDMFGFSFPKNLFLLCAFKKKSMECGERKWAEPGTEVAAVVIVSCAAWEGGELALSTSSLEVVGGGHPGGCTVPCPAGCLGQVLEGKQQSQPGKTRR